MFTWKFDHEDVARWHPRQLDDGWDTQENNTLDWRQKFVPDESLLAEYSYKINNHQMLYVHHPNITIWKFCVSIFISTFCQCRSISGVRNNQSNRRSTYVEGLLKKHVWLKLFLFLTISSLPSFCLLSNISTFWR